MKSIVLISLLLAIFACEDTKPAIDNVDFRQEMRNFVQKLSTWAKSQDPTFSIIPQNGQELITDTGAGDGEPQTDYLAAIDATGRESMFFGYYADDEQTPEEDKQHLLDLCILCEANQVEVINTDYCYTHSKMDASYALNEQYGFTSFAADHRDLNDIPNYPATPYSMNADTVRTLADARNVLYLINGDQYEDKAALITAVAKTNYDLIIMDAFHNESAFTAAEVTQLQIKANGAPRLVVAYMSIGEAEDYRYYWQSTWQNHPPVWLEPENPNWAGNYKVRYWDTDWQAIIYGNESSYLQRIINAGFDGTYLDIIDGFEYFEEL